ncbi:MAG: metallophosphoesterase [Bacteroidetes bacterium]|nr:metallophosphoesterase [Bacteroidota bacterium]
MIRIAHISDIHFGRISHPTIVDALIRDINRAGVDLVVVSGDLTQRAFGHQFRAVRRMLDAFDAPTLVVPGNHDVFPWWRLFSRLFDPLRRYEKIITPDLAPHVELPGVVVQGINSAFGWTVQGGRITEKELQQIRDGFSTTPEGAFRILVVHHHLAELEQLGDHDISKGAEKAFRTTHEMKVDLILCGHLHISHVAHVSIHNGAKPIVIATSGTSTSSRGRGSDPAANFFNLIEITKANSTIVELRFNPEKRGFFQHATHTLPRY